MKDADFAALLRSISIQNQLRSITYINNEFREESLAALLEIITREHKQSSGISPTKKEHDFDDLESLKLCNLRSDQSTIRELLRVIEDRDLS